MSDIPGGIPIHCAACLAPLQATIDRDMLLIVPCPACLESEARRERRLKAEAEVEPAMAAIDDIERAFLAILDGMKETAENNSKEDQNNA